MAESRAISNSLSWSNVSGGAFHRCGNTGKGVRMRRQEIDSILDLRLLWILELIMSNWQRDASFDFWAVVTRKIIIV